LIIWKSGKQGGVITTFESLGECLEYDCGVIVMDIALPHKAPYCQYCSMIKTEEFLKRFTCRVTGEYLLYPFTSRGKQCPIQFKEDVDG
jgi:hypothetical protein